MIEYRDFALWIGELSLLTVVTAVENINNFELKDIEGNTILSIDKEQLTTDEIQILRNINA